MYFLNYSYHYTAFVSLEISGDVYFEDTGWKNYI